MEAVALHHAAEQLTALCEAAAGFGIPEPASGWKALDAAVRAVAAGRATIATAASEPGDPCLPSCIFH